MLSSEIRLNASGLLAVGPAKVEQFLTPELVKFVIGSKKTEFNLHLSLVSFLSTRLYRLIENSRQCIYLKDVDEDVFSRFSQFVYSGSYKLESQGNPAVKCCRTLKTHSWARRARTSHHPRVRTV
ncbi:hypothetical protein H9L39_16611 [Fusarium oxysporum f. sp. albedinis]|nr:hypothetical protein H9L39_16611 [Fusarium oxysporum f. sp. albedinis]